jgi:hypothetical protein
MATTKLLAVEEAKLRPSRELRVSLAVYALLVALALASLRAVAFELPGGRITIAALAFPDVWHNAAYVAGWVNYLLYVIALQTVTHEYQFRTNRQNVIDGLPRRRYVLGKIAVMAGFALISSAIMIALASAAGMWTGAAAASEPLAIRFVPLYAAQTLGYLMLALFVATLARRTGRAVLLFVGYTLVAEPLLRDLAVPHGIARHLPSAAFAALVPNPFFAYAGMRVTSPLTAPLVDTAIYVCLLAAATLGVFEKQDL